MVEEDVNLPGKQKSWMDLEGVGKEEHVLMMHPRYP
jgi:hypothetical protein